MYLAKAENAGVARYNVSRDQYDPATLSLVAELRQAIDEESWPTRSSRRCASSQVHSVVDLGHNLGHRAGEQVTLDEAGPVRMAVTA